jgi:hypothetical protein
MRPNARSGPGSTLQRKEPVTGMTPPEPHDTGPFETEHEAADSVRHIYGMEPGTGAWAAASHRLLCEALSDAGVELGAYDHAIVQWLAGWEPSTVAVIAGLISRAHEAGREVITMGIYLGNRWLRLRFTRRGVRAGIGPRWARVWAGRGGPGVSSGAGPLTLYHGLRRRRRR